MNGLMFIVNMVGNVQVLPMVGNFIFVSRNRCLAFAKDNIKN